MFTIALVYIGVILALVAFSKWLSKSQDEKAYKAAEERFQRRAIDYSSMPSRRVIAQFRSSYKA